MPNYSKHEGKLTTDGNGVVILYGMIESTNPLATSEDYDHCFVYVLGSTSPAFETPLLQYVRSKEGQNARDVGDVLNKYTLGNESRSILQTLRATDKIKKVSVDQVMIVLNSSMAFPLRNWVELNRPKKSNEIDSNKSEPSDNVDDSVFNQSFDAEEISNKSDNNSEEAIIESKEELKQMIEMLTEELKKAQEKYDRLK